MTRTYCIAGEIIQIDDDERERGAWCFNGYIDEPPLDETTDDEIQDAIAQQIFKETETK